MQHLFPGRRAPLALALAASFSTPIQAQTSDTTPLQQVVVTGSRISRIQAEGPSAVTVLKSGDIDRLGYRNVADALAALTENTGFTQGEDYGNTFQPAANALSVRGLGPNHQLFLLNGRRIADYPTAYGGQANFVDTSNIPAVLIDRIEVLSGGASAIYGSDAVAGVINVILKKRVDVTTLNLKAGSTQLGGGENLRAQISGGLNQEQLQAVWGVELSQRKPIWDRQRDHLSDTTRYGAAPTVVFGRQDASTKKYIGADAESCSQGAGLFGGSVALYSGSKGKYCGSGEATPRFWTNQTGKRSSSFAGALNYQLSPQTELFTEGLLNFTTTYQNTRGPNWTSNSAPGQPSYFRNASTGKLETWSRRLAPEEIGGAERYDRYWHDRSANLAIGARGDLFDGRWNYELALNSSIYSQRQPTPVLLAGIDNFFLGQRQGLDAGGVPIYQPSTARLYKPLTSDEFEGLVGLRTSFNKSWTHNLAANLGGELLSLPGGPLRVAAVAELGRQGFLNRDDRQAGKGLYYSDTPKPESTGTRDRYAVGVEFNAPLSKQFTVTTAGRYDNYRFVGRNEGSFTYNTGLEFRPSADLLLRAQHATSFRAPELNLIYSTVTRGYYASGTSTDYYLCAKLNQPLSKCDFAKLSRGFDYVSSSSKDLNSEKGKSWNLGLVYAPSNGFEFSLDFWKISLDDQIRNLSGDNVMRLEADCRLGRADIKSPSCVDAIRRVTRRPEDAAVRPGEVVEIAINPINVAKTATYGYDLGSKYIWKTQGWGDFTLTGKFTKVLSYTYQAAPQDPVRNQIGTEDYDGFPNRLNASLTWHKDVWTHTLSAQRNGKVALDEGFFGPYWSFNASSKFELSKQTSLRLIVNNLLGDIRYRREDGNTPTSLYLPYGRQFWVEAEHRF